MSNTPKKPGLAFWATVVVMLLLMGYGVSQGLLIAWRPIVIREATPDDETFERYFGIDSEGSPQLRNIAVLEGAFSTWTQPVARLYLVQDGKVDEVNAFDFGRSLHQVG